MSWNKVEGILQAHGRGARSVRIILGKVRTKIARSKGNLDFPKFWQLDKRQHSLEITEGTSSLMAGRGDK